MPDSDSLQPASSPLPVQTLDYLPPPASSRPGILTALAVVSIVIGSLSALMGCWGVVGTGMLVFMSGAAPVAPAPPPATAPANTVNATSGGVVITKTAFSTTTMFSPVTDPLTLAASIADGVLRLLLALLLIAAGVLVLREHRLGRKLHVIWAWAKIPAAMLGAIASWHMSSSMLAAMPPTPGMAPASFRMVMLISAAFQAVLACIYPVVVLIMMHTRTVRDYYASRFGVATAGGR